MKSNFFLATTCPVTLGEAPAACRVAGELEVIASRAGPVTCRGGHGGAWKTNLGSWMS